MGWLCTLRTGGLPWPENPGGWASGEGQVRGTQVRGREAGFYDGSDEKSLEGSEQVSDVPSWVFLKDLHVLVREQVVGENHRDDSGSRETSWKSATVIQVQEGSLWPGKQRNISS